MPYLSLPDGSYTQVPDGITNERAIELAKQKFPELYGIKPASIAGTDTVSTQQEVRPVLTASHIDSAAAFRDAAFAVGAAFVAGAFLFIIFKPAKGAKTRFTTARRWTAWATLAICATTLAKAVARPSADQFLRFGLVAISVLPAVFLVGLVKQWLFASSDSTERETAHGSAIDGSAGTLSTATINPEQESRIYSTIAEEIKNGTVDQGMWIRSFAETDGDESRTRVLYVKRRFEQEKVKYKSGPSPEVG